MLFVTVITFAYRGSYNRFIVDLGEIAIVLWVPLILIGVFLIVAGAFIDKD